MHEGVLPPLARPVYALSILGAVLVLGGVALAGWWYSGGDTIIRVKLGDTQLEGLVGSKEQREASDFVDSLLELTE